MAAWKVVHQISGRMRLRNSGPVAKETLDALAAKFGKWDGVTRVEINPQAYSMLIHFLPEKICPSAILESFPLGRETKPKHTDKTVNIAKNVIGLGVFAYLIKTHYKLFRLRPINLFWWAVIIYLLDAHKPTLKRWVKNGLAG